MLLILSLIALVLGPVLYGACRRNEAVRRSLDGFLFVAIAGLVIVHIAPDVFEIIGFAAFVMLALGAAFAFSAERRSMMTGGNSYSLIVLIGALGLAVHAAMDGIALLPVDLHGHGLHGHDLSGHDAIHQTDPAHGHEHTEGGGIAALMSNHLALGVILHRIPVGMAIWWTLRPLLGAGVAAGAIALIAAATSAAYLLGEPIIALLNTSAVASFQAFVAGTLLHVIVFTSVQREVKSTSSARSYNAVSERLGILLGLFVVFLVPHAH